MSKVSSSGPNAVISLVFDSTSHCPNTHNTAAGVERGQQVHSLRVAGPGTACSLPVDRDHRQRQPGTDPGRQPARDDPVQRGGVDALHHPAGRRLARRPPARAETQPHRRCQVGAHSPIAT